MIIQILEHTPAWVYVLFAALLFLGALQARTLRLTPQRLLLLPAVMVGWSLYGVLSAFGPDVSALAEWGAVLVAATVSFAALGLGKKASYAPDTRTFTVPGSWLPMAAILVVFFARYVINVSLAVDSSLRASALFAAGAAAVYGVSSGFFAARALGIARRATAPLAA